MVRIGMAAVSVAALGSVVVVGAGPAMAASSNTVTVGPSAGALRKAVDAANAAGGTTTIVLKPGQYTLQSGSLKITGHVFLAGSGTSSTVISGGGKSRVIRVASSAQVQIRDLTVRHGVEKGGNGGGILNNGSLSLVGVNIINNQAIGTVGAFSGAGGGIADFGQLIVEDVTFTGNQAIGSVGAPGQYAGGGGGGGAGLGGGLFVGNGASVSGTLVSFYSNQAQGGQGGASGFNNGVAYSNGGNGGGNGGLGGTSSHPLGGSGQFAGGGGGGYAAPGWYSLMYNGGAGGYGAGGGGGGGSTMGGTGGSGGIAGYGAGNGGTALYSSGSGGGGGAGIGGALCNDGGSVNVPQLMMGGNQVHGGAGGRGGYSNGSSGHGLGPDLATISGTTQGVVMGWSPNSQWTSPVAP